MSAPVKLQLEYRDNCLVLRTHERDVLERRAATVQAIANAIRAKPVRATLVDLRAVPGPVTFIDRQQLGEMAGRYLPRLRLAVRMQEAQADPKRIGQLAARNRGINVEVFTEQAVAEAWLKKTSTSDRNPTAAP